MDKELQKKKPEQKEKDSSLNMILCSSLVIILLLLVELFLMISMPQMLPAIAVVGVIIVGCAYLDLSTCMKRLRKKEQEQEEQYASILKSEKASYLLIRKYFDEIEEQLTLLEDKFTDPFQEVIAAQKATAKVTINRNKENTDALMNSNDKLLELMFNLESKMEEASNMISAGFREQAKDQNADVLQKQIEMSNQMRELELSLRNEILQAVNKLSSVSPQVVMASPQMMQMQQPVTMPSMPEMGSFSMPESSDSVSQAEDADDLGGLGELPDFVPFDAVEENLEASDPEFMHEPEPMPEPEPVVEELPSMPEPEPVVEELPSMPEPEPVIEELPPMPDLSDPNKMMSPDDIAALLANMNAESSVVADETAEAKPIAEPEPEPIPEPAVEELPPMPDLSDPNKMMSPDDIAALLANMNAESSVVADETAEAKPIAEPEPEPIPEPAVEELPPMPDLSDPNKMMSPDEIEALLASMAADTASAAALPDVEEEEPEPEPEEEKPPMPDLSDPNRQMSPDEIAALFANMGS